MPVVSPTSSPVSGAHEGDSSACAGPAWDVLHPHPHGWWSGSGEGPGGRHFGLYDPASGAFGVVEPTDDAELPGLVEWLGRGELVDYRAGRWALLREGRGRIYAKVLRPREARGLVARTATVTETARRSPGFPALAPLVGGAAPAGVVRLRALNGWSIRDLVAEDWAANIPVLTLDRVGVALARFQVPATAVELPPAPPVSEPAEWAALIGRAAPELASRLAAVAAALPAAPTGGPEVLVHGDLHDGNVLVGRRVGILDLDLLHTGSAATDVGNLAAYLVLRGLQLHWGRGWGRLTAARLIAAYSAAGGVASQTDIAAAGSRSLFRLACLYRFRRHWDFVVPGLLDEAAVWASSFRSVPVEERRARKLG